MMVNDELQLEGRVCIFSICISFVQPVKEGVPRAAPLANGC